MKKKKKKEKGVQHVDVGKNQMKLLGTTCFILSGIPSYSNASCKEKADLLNFVCFKLA